MSGNPGRTNSRDVAVEWGQSLLWLDLVLVTVLFSTRTTESFELPKLMVVRAVAIVMLAGAVCRLGSRRAAEGSGAPGRRMGSFLTDPLGLGILLSLLAGGVSTVLSTSPRTSILGAQGSFAGLLAVAACSILFFATRALCPDAESARSVLSGAVAGLGLSVGYGFVQLAGLDPWRWEAPVAFAGLARVFSTQGHPNSFAQLLATGMPMAAYAALWALRAGRFVEAVLFGLIAAGAVGLALLTLSRAGALAMATALLILVAGWGSFSRVPRRWRFLGVPALAALLATAVALAILSDASGHGLGAWSSRLAELGRPTGAHEPRRHLWAAAWRMFRDHPWVGVGLDCFSLAFGRYRTAAGWITEWGQTPVKAHCQPLEVLATRGLVGAASGLLVAFGTLKAFVQAVRKPDGEPLLATATLASLAAFGVHGLFHFPTAAGTTLALTAAAILSRQAEPARVGASVPKAASWRWRVAGGLAAALLLHVLVLRPLRGDVLGRAAAVLMATDPARAVAYAREAVRLDGSRDLLWLRLSAATQAAAGRASPSAERRALFEESRRAAERAVHLVPVNAYSQAHLGTLLADLERERLPLAGRAEVEGAFERAGALDPNNADILVAAGTAAMAAGDDERAEAWATRCGVLYPGFAPPQALLGAVSLHVARELVASGQERAGADKLREAQARLATALASEWHGDEAARAAAEANLRAARTGGPLETQTQR